MLEVCEEWSGLIRTALNVTVTGLLSLAPERPCGFAAASGSLIPCVHHTKGVAAGRDKLARAPRSFLLCDALNYCMR